MRRATSDKSSRGAVKHLSLELRVVSAGGRRTGAGVGWRSRLAVDSPSQRHAVAERTPALVPGRRLTYLAQ